jgi:hypothetical protein
MILGSSKLSLADEETVAPRIVAGRADVLKAIDVVLNECVALQLRFPDAALGQEILGLQNARIVVERQWPLSDTMKVRANLGAIAAKNIDDWNPDLASH